MRRRITIICNDADYFLRHRRATADALADAGHEVRVITGGRPLPPGTGQKWQHVHVPIERWKLAPIRDLRLVLTTMREILGRPPHALHLITLKPIVVCGLAAVLARLAGPRHMMIVATVPGLGRLMSPTSRMNSRMARNLVAAAIRLLAHRPGVTFTFETAFDRAHWVDSRLVPPGQAVVIGGAGVDPRIFHPATTPDPDRPFRVLFASRLLRAKGLDIFLEAARTLSRERIEFLVAGVLEPADPDAIGVEAFRAEPGIRFLGQCDDMPALLRQVDVVVLPTLYGEGIPRILVEAAATGIPAIASDQAGCREIVADGVTGTIIAQSPGPAMTTDLVQALTRYGTSRDLRQRHGAAARQHFLAGDYAEDKIIARFTALLVSGG